MDGVAQAAPRGALDGRLVLDVASALGAYVRRLLGDLGADVMKIEPPGIRSGRQGRASRCYRVNASGRPCHTLLPTVDADPLETALASAAHPDMPGFLAYVVRVWCRDLACDMRVVPRLSGR